jgi:hypothetical protein
MIVTVVAVVAACLMLRIVALLRADSCAQAERLEVYRIRAAFAAEPRALDTAPAPVPVVPGGDWPARQTPTDLADAYTGTPPAARPVRAEYLPHHARVATGEWAAIVSSLVTDQRALELAAVAT